MVKLNVKNDLKGNKNCFKLAGALNYRGYQLPRVKLKLMYDRNPGEIDFGFKVQISEGVSYQESTVLPKVYNN